MTHLLEVIAHGMSAARTRINALASNVANAQTTKTEDGTPYKRKDVVQIAVSTGENMFTPQTNVVEDESEPRLVFEPSHPDANQDGYVAYPNINVVSTMTDLVSASRLYQAMVTTLDVAKEMSNSANRISLKG